MQAKAASQTPVEAIGTIKGEIKLEAVVAVAVLALDTYVSGRRSVLVVVRGCGRWSSKL